MILIVGRTAAGKDTLAYALKNKYGLKPVLSRTTRKKRGDNDKSHIFVSREQAIQEMENALAKTEIDNQFYYVLPKDLKDKDIFIVDPNGVKELIKSMPSAQFDIIYVQAKDDIRKERFIKRSKGKDPEEEWLSRTKSEAKQFDDFEKEIVDKNSSYKKTIKSLKIIINNEDCDIQV